MDDYKIGFDLDSKIAQNRHKLREQFEQYKKIENYYPLFLAYIGAFGIYFFDFLVSRQTTLFTVVTTLTTLSFLYSCYIMYTIVQTKIWANDVFPKDLYETHLSGLKKANPSVTDEHLLIQETKKYYLDILEKAVVSNFKVYEDKKKKFPSLFKVMTLSLILYSVNITVYKNIKMQDETKVTPKQVVTSQSETPVQIILTVEGVNSPDTTKTILTEQAGDSSKTGQ
jgi:hypothetical protein